MAPDLESGEREGGEKNFLCRSTDGMLQGSDLGSEDGKDGS